MIDKLLGAFFGGSGEKQSTQIPEWLDTALQANVRRAQDLQQMDYMPYAGATVAAMTPSQQSAMSNTASMAQQYGMAAPSSPNLGMPTAQDFGNGLMAYSSMPIYDQAMWEARHRMPALMDYRNSMFIDPVTGAYGSRTQGGQALDALKQLGVNTSGLNANTASIYSDGDSGSSFVPQSGLSGDSINKLRALSENPWMKTGPFSGLLAMLLGKYADTYAGDYGKEGQPSVYGNDMFYRSTMSPDTGGNLMPTPVRGSDFYSSSEAQSNQDRANSAKAALDQALTNIIYSDGGEPTFSSGSGSLGVGGGNASRGYTTGGW